MAHDVVSLGELLIDLVPLPDDGQGLSFVAKPGGAPGNAAVGLAKLGRSVAMLSKVGADAFGRLLTSTVEAAGVSIAGIAVSPVHRTGLAVVTLDAGGDRDFLFYRENCADVNFAVEEVREDLIRAAGVLHVNSLVLASPISAAAQRHAVSVARTAGILVSADPNLRPLLWADRAAMVAAAREVVEIANILKIGEDELAAITGISDPHEALKSLRHPGLQVAAITAGARGATIVTPKERVTVQGMPVQVVDTTGAGDAFMAAFLAGLLASGFDLSRVSLEKIGIEACAFGAITTTAAGGMDAMPDRAKLESFLGDRS
jgi:fructokinase